MESALRGAFFMKIEINDLPHKQLACKNITFDISKIDVMQHSKCILAVFMMFSACFNADLKAETGCKWCVGSINLRAFDAQDSLLDEWGVGYIQNHDVYQHPDPNGHVEIDLWASFECYMVGMMEQVDVVVIRNVTDTVHFVSMTSTTLSLPAITLPGSYRVFLYGVAGGPLYSHFQLGASPVLILSPYAILAGAWDDGNSAMRDDLRVADQIPEYLYTGSSWYSIGWYNTTQSDVTISGGALLTSGDDAVVDWIFVDLRHPLTNEILYRLPGLLKRSGLITASDGISPLVFKATAGNYRIAIIHRNHLSIMTLDPIPLYEGNNTIDLRDATIPLFGTEPAKNLGSVRGLWPGKTRGYNVQYTGPNNDRDAVLQFIGGTIPTNTVTGNYSNCDVNLDGIVKYSGAGNDRDVILQTIGGTVPTVIRTEQVPWYGW